MAFARQRRTEHGDDRDRPWVRLRPPVTARGVTVVLIDCRQPKGAWSAGAMFEDHALLIMRRGEFRRRLRGRDEFVGPSSAYFIERKSEEEILHPGHAGDTSTMIFLSDEAAYRLTGDVELPDTLVLTSGSVDLAHRRLVAHLAQLHDPVEGEERLAWLVGLLIGAAAPRRVSHRPTTATSHRRITEVAKEAITADPVGADLPRLASLVGHSPIHLSRVFRRSTGLTLGGYRNRIRAAMALDRLEGGETDLAGLAADLGFVDQAYMTRIVRQQVGVPPGRAQNCSP